MIKLICLSMKKYKNLNYKYIYHIMLETSDLEKYYNKLKYLETYDFKIDLLDVKLIENKIDKNLKDYDTMRLSYVKCLIPTLFPHLDKILCLDIDLLIFNSGIENLFQQDISDNYAMACYDIPTQMVKQHIQKINCKVNNYFNAGVLLFNLKKIRQDGLDKILEYDLINWPEGLINHIYDNTLLNFRFKEKIFWLDINFNNNILSINEEFINFYNIFLKYFNYENLLDSLNNVIIIHWSGLAKPWTTTDFSNIVPYFNLSKKIFIQAVKDLLNE